MENNTTGIGETSKADDTYEDFLYNYPQKKSFSKFYIFVIVGLLVVLILEIIYYFVKRTQVRHLELNRSPYALDTLCTATDDKGKTAKYMPVRKYKDGVVRRMNPRELV